MSPKRADEHVDILLVEDNEGDARLIKEGLGASRFRNTLHHVVDGEEALGFLRREGRWAAAPRPGFILLDLNLPRKDGRELLAELKVDASLKRIPVVVLTVSSAAEDILKAYDLHANCYITKPIELSQTLQVVRSIEDFWLATVRLPG